MNDTQKESGSGAAHDQEPAQRATPAGTALRAQLEDLPYDAQLELLRPAPPLQLSRSAGGDGVVQMQEACLEPPESSPVVGADEPLAQQAADLAGRVGADPALAVAVAREVPARCERLLQAFEADPSNARADVVDALLRYALCPDALVLSAELAANEWFQQYAVALQQVLPDEPLLALALLAIDRSMDATRVAESQEIVVAYAAVGRSADLALREQAFTVLLSLGELDFATASQVDAILLTGSADAYVDEAVALTDEIAEAGFQLIAEVQTLSDTWASTPGYADMEALYQVLLAFDEQVQGWNARIAELQAPAVRWTLWAAEEATGADFEAILDALGEGFENTVSEYYASTEYFNRTEIEREQQLQTAGTLRIDNGTNPLGDQDWHVLHVPGLVVERMPVSGSRATRQGDARAPGEITAGVLHTGGATNEDTVDTLSSRNLTGHYGVDTSGAVVQMYPAGLEGVHAGAANPDSVAIDLAFGPDVRSSGGAQVAFMNSGEQLIATARLLNTQANVSPAIDDGAHVRGELFGTLLPHVAGLEGAYGGIADLSSVSPDLSGVVAHEDMPDSDHSDPGPVYMQRLYFMMPFLEAYEARYGPVRVEDPSEVEAVIQIFERYLAEGDFLPISQDELMAEVERRAASESDPTDPSTLDSLMSDVFDDMMKDLAEDYYDTQGSSLSAQTRHWRTLVDAQVSDSDIHVEGSKPERDFFRDNSTQVIPGYSWGRHSAYQEWLRDSANAAEVSRLRGLAGWRAVRDEYREDARSGMARRIAVGMAYVTVLDERLEAFRAYLESQGDLRL